MDCSMQNTVLTFSFLVTLVCLTLVPSTDAKTPLSLYGVLPGDKSSQDAIKSGFSELGLLSRDRRLSRFMRPLRKKYSFATDTSSIRYANPEVVLETFCDGILTGGVNSIMQIINPYIMTQDVKGAAYISKLAAYLGIPEISWDVEFVGMNQSGGERRYLQMAPTIFHQAKAMLAFMKVYNWTDFVVATSLYRGNGDFITSIKKIVKQHEEDFKLRAEIRYRMLEEPFVINASDPDTIRRYLTKINETDTRIILLFADKIETMDIFEIAEEVGLTRNGFVWILSHNSIGNTYDPRDPKTTRNFPVGTLALYIPQSKAEITRISRTAAKIWLHGIVGLAKNGELRNMLTSPNFTCNDTGRMFWDDGRKLYEAMRTVRLPKADSVEFDENGVNKHAEIKVLNIHPHNWRHHSWSTAGVWNSTTGLNVHGIKWMGGSLFPPKGKPDLYKLRVVTLVEKPFVDKNLTTDVNGNCPNNTVKCLANSFNGSDFSGMDREYRCCAGLAIDLLRMFGTRLNFEYELFEVEDGMWGEYDNTTGSWNGLIGTLHRGEADMVVTNMATTPKYLQQVKFSMPYMETGISIMVAKRKGQISATAFLEPFDAWSWCFILIFSVHATGTAIFIFEWISPLGLQKTAKTEEQRFSLFRAFWLIWAMLFGAAVSTDNPNAVSSRFVSNIWALFSLVFLASYTANLAAFMITREDYYDLSGIEDWRLNPYAMDPPFRYSTVKNSPSSHSILAYHKQKHNYMVKEKLLQPDLETAIESLKNGTIHALMYDGTVLDYYAGKDEDCRLLTVGDRYAMTGYGIAFPQNSIWIEKVNRIILEMQRFGDIDRLQKYWLAGACKDKMKRQQQSHELGILNFTSAFIFLAGGILLGVIVLICEHAYFKFGRKELKKWDKCGCCALISYSMNQSLSFESSVMQAINLKTKHKCKDPVCHTLLWEAKHKLDVALITIEQLKKEQGKPSRPLRLKNDTSDDALINKAREADDPVKEQTMDDPSRYHANKSEGNRVPIGEVYTSQESPVPTYSDVFPDRSADGSLEPEGEEMSEREPFIPETTNDNTGNNTHKRSPASRSSKGESLV